MKRRAWLLAAFNLAVASQAGAQSSAAPCACPELRVAQCSSLGATLEALVEQACANPSTTRRPTVNLELVEGTCERPQQIRWSSGAARGRVQLDETRNARWRFVVLSVLPDVPSPCPDGVSQREQTDGTGTEHASREATPWVDPRPLATEDDIARWQALQAPHQLEDTGRGATALALRLGGAVNEGSVGTASLQIRHRFESPWTLGVQVHPAMVARLGGQTLGRIVAAARGGYDGRIAAAELTLGLAPSRGGFRPAGMAPTVGALLRIGIEDTIAARLSFALMVASGVRVHRIGLRFQARVLDRFRAFSELEGHFANGAFWALVGVDGWLVGRGEAGSWSLGAAFGALFVQYKRQCEFGDCDALGAESESFAGPTMQLRLETRL